MVTLSKPLLQIHFLKRIRGYLFLTVKNKKPLKGVILVSFLTDGWGQRVSQQTRMASAI